MTVTPPPPPGHEPPDDPYRGDPGVQGDRGPTPQPGGYGDPPTPPGGYGQPSGGYGQPPGGGYGSPPGGYGQPAQGGGWGGYGAGGTPPGGVPPGQPPGGGRSGDPLWSDDVGGWWQRGMEVFQRSWRTIAVLMLIGVFIPSVILGSTNSLTGVDLYGASMDEYDTEMIGRSAPSLIAALIVGYLTALAWTAALRAAVKESVGESVSVGESLAYGLRRGLRLWGWGILAYLTVVIGLVLCVLPGLWALFALSLIAPAATFEAGSPYVRSIKLTHRNFGGALGRLVLAWLVIVLFGCVVGLIGGAVSAAAAVALSGVAEVIVLILVQAVMSLVLIIPSVWLVGMILCTYVWARGRTEPVSAASLSMEADR